MADAVVEEQEPAKETYAIAKVDIGGFDENQDPSAATRETRLEELAVKARLTLMKQGYSEESIIIEKYLNMRYQGTDNAIMIKEKKTTDIKLPYAKTFVDNYHREFGFELEGRDILVDDYRVRAFVPGPLLPPQLSMPLIGSPTPSGSTRAYFESGWENGKFAAYRCNLIHGHYLPTSIYFLITFYRAFCQCPPLTLKT